MNIAFVAVGRRVELVKAFRTALTDLGAEGLLIGIDADPLAPALQVCDRSCLAPRLNDPRFIPSLLEIVARERVDLMFPLIDPVIEVLAEHRVELERAGAKVSAVPLDSARLASDKLLLFSFFRALGLATPKTWLPNEIDPDSAGYPLFLKPRRGSASQDAYRIRNTKELLFFQDFVQDPIIQEFVPGPEITTDVICDLEGQVLGIVSRRRIEVRSGEVSKGVTVHDNVIQDACVRIAKAFPAIGPITVQCLMKDGEPLFTEINARLGGGVPLAVAAGVNVPALLLARFAGIDTKMPELGAYETGLHMTRYDDSFFLSSGDMQKDGAADWIERGNEKASRITIA